MDTFGIAITNLPYLFPDDERLSLNKKGDMSAERTLDGIKRINGEELNRLLLAIKDQLDENAKISPDSVNSHPEGVQGRMMTHPCMWHNTKHQNWSRKQWMGRSSSG